MTSINLITAIVTFKWDDAVARSCRCGGCGARPFCIRCSGEENYFEESGMLSFDQDVNSPVLCIPDIRHQSTSLTYDYSSHSTLIRCPRHRIFSRSRLIIPLGCPAQDHGFVSTACRTSCQREPNVLLYPLEIDEIKLGSVDGLRWPTRSLILRIRRHRISSSRFVHPSLTCPIHLLYQQRNTPMTKNPKEKRNISTQPIDKDNCSSDVAGRQRTYGPRARLWVRYQYREKF